MSLAFRRFAWISLNVAILLGLMVTAASGSATVTRTPLSGIRPAAEVIIVLVAPDPEPARIAVAQSAVLGALGPADFQVTYRYRAIPALSGRLSAAGLAALARHPAVRAVGPDLPGSGGLASSVPYIHADRAHALGVTGRGVRVALLDTGVDAAHPDLAGRVAGEACFVRLAPGCPAGPHPAADDHGHGTNVGGIIASAGRLAPPGVAPGAELVAIKVLNNRNRFISSDVLAGISFRQCHPKDTDLLLSAMVQLHSPYFRSA